MGLAGAQPWLWGAVQVKVASMKTRMDGRGPEQRLGVNPFARYTGTEIALDAAATTNM